MNIQSFLSKFKIYSKTYMFVNSLFKPSINKFNNLHNWKECKKIYFKNLSFIDIEDNIDAYKRYKRINETDLNEIREYTIGYEKDNKLLKLEEFVNKKIIKETYLIYNQNEHLHKVYDFWKKDKYYHKKEDELFTMWNYEYQNSKLSKLKIKYYADYNYAHHNTNYLIRYYTWDEKGIESIHQTFIRNELLHNVIVYENLLFKKRGLTNKEIIEINKGKI